MRWETSWRKPLFYYTVWRRGISSGTVHLISFVKMTPHPLSNQWEEWTAFPTCEVETMHISFSAWLISRRQDKERNRCWPIRSFYFIKQTVEEGRSIFFEAGTCEICAERLTDFIIFFQSNCTFRPLNICTNLSEDFILWSFTVTLKAD